MQQSHRKGVSLIGPDFSILDFGKLFVKYIADQPSPAGEEHEVGDSAVLFPEVRPAVEGSLLYILSQHMAIWAGLGRASGGQDKQTWKRKKLLVVNKLDYISKKIQRKKEEEKITLIDSKGPLHIKGILALFQVSTTMLVQSPKKDMKFFGDVYQKKSKKVFSILVSKPLKKKKNRPLVEFFKKI